MDYNNHKNIEEWFLSLDKSVFPNNTDYPTIYKNAKEILEKSVHNEIKAIAITFIKEEYLTDHGVDHINKVIERASKLLEKSKHSLTPYETFFLLMSIQIHDAGHLINGRKNHRDNTALVINKVINPLSLQTSEKTIIKKIAQAHSGKDDPIGKLQREMHINETFYPQLLAAIIRVSDELADNCLRASTFLLEIGSDKIDEHSKIHHLYSQSLDSCRIFASANDVEQEFVLNKELVLNKIQTPQGEIFLADQIFSNSVKTFTECIYCNRFLPTSLRIDRLSISINFIDSEALEYFMEPIKYRIEESGYPAFHTRTIYDHCPSLKENGNEINGQYLQSKAEQL